MIATKQRSLNRRRDNAFTLTDLITVLAVLLILGAIQSPSVANTKGKGQVASCLSNHRHLVSAWQSYAQDNNGTLVGNVSSLANSNITWVLGWLDPNPGNDSAFPQKYGGQAN